MSVIIRLQNLPWSANALDIRQFFKGLSIPEGGVHIVGGELGDAFIAFSTDEDARQAMMHDRECIKEVQVRLLLSSRAEMQKVIETARLQSISLLQQMALRTATPLDIPATVPNGGVKIPITQQVTTKPVVVSKPQAIPNNMNNLLIQPTSFLAYQQQAGITLTGSPISNETLTDSKNKSENNLNDSSRRSSYEGRRSPERDRHRSSSKDRHRSRREGSSRSRSRDRDRGKERDRERDSKSRRNEKSHRSRSRESRDRSADRSRSRGFNRSGRHTESKDRDLNNRSGREPNISSWNANSSPADKEKPKTTSISSWGMTPMNAYQTNQYQTTPSNSYSTTTNTNTKESASTFGTVATRTASATIQSSPEVVIPAFQNYTSNITNNYSVNLFGSNGGSNSNSSDSAKPFVLQNPYTTALQNANTDSDSQTTNASGQGMSMSAAKSNIASDVSTTSNNFQTLAQEPIAFAKTNPYEQMYPNLFAQAAAQSMPRSNATAAQRTGSPVYKSNEPIAYPDSSSIKVSNMCSSTNYSDLRKFFAGLFIPHNGIKMVNDRHGLRIGIAFIQFSRQSSVAKALTRNHSILKSKSIKIEVVPDEEFAKAEDSYRPSSRFDRQNHNDSDMDRDRRYDSGSNQTGTDKNPFKKQSEESDDPFNVLYIEELPPLTTEQDIMKMFSSYTLYDILLMPSVDNRREFVAYVKFSLAEDAKAAYDDKSKHLIGYRKVRVQPGKEGTMEMAKEKLRLANEQLLKEEQDEEDEKAARVAANLKNIRNEKSFKDRESNIVDLIEDDESESKMNTMTATRTSRDPRLIPSLFDMPATKPPIEGGDNNNKINASPTDPRLRTRQRPSRFDSETKNTSTNNLNISNNNNNNNNNNNMNNDNNNGSNNNGHPMGLPNNQFNQVNNSNMNMNNSNNNNNGNGNGNFNEMFRYQQMNPMEDNFVLLYNCPYNIRINDVGELFISANLQVKHVEMLNTDRGIPAGEFIVEVSDPREAELAVNDFHNIQFHGRSLRVRQIKPQEIADRLGKPFMNYVPGGNGNSGGFGFNNMGGGMFMNSGGMRPNSRDNDMNFNSNNNNNNMGAGGGGGGGSPIRRKRSGRTGRSGRNNIDDMNDDADDDMSSRTGDNSGPNNNGIPEKFTRPDCVLAMENVPYKADSEDILRFFGHFKLRPDDIIRRFNDEGAPTGDARVAFRSASDAREAYEKLNRKQIFNRTIYLNIL